LLRVRYTRASLSSRRHRCIGCNQNVMSERISPTLELTRQLLSRASVSPEDQGCLDVIAARLARS